MKLRINVVTYSSTKDGFPVVCHCATSLLTHTISISSEHLLKDFPHVIKVQQPDKCKGESQKCIAHREKKKEMYVNNRGLISHLSTIFSWHYEEKGEIGFFRAHTDLILSIMTLAFSFAGTTWIHFFKKRRGLSTSTSHFPVYQASNECTYCHEKRQYSHLENS